MLQLTEFNKCHFYHQNKVTPITEHKDFTDYTAINMNTIQGGLINPFTLTMFSRRPMFYTSKWDSLFLKKFITPQWPFEIYKGSLLQDFWSVLSSINKA